MNLGYYERGTSKHAQILISVKVDELQTTVMDLPNEAAEEVDLVKLMGQLMGPVGS